MKTESLAYPYIVIEGNIGVGKTTFCRKLQEKYGARLILEQFSDNPFLPYFYENPERHAFSVELFFMTERHRQLQEELIQGNLFNQQIISDYIFIKTLLFAKNNLNEEEYRLFNRLFHVLNAHFKKPDLFVYLHRPISSLMTQIKKRGRSYEMEMSTMYLENIQKAYFDLLKSVLKSKGFVILAEFNLEGAKKCSGLDVFRYDSKMLHERLGADFKLIKEFEGFNHSLFT